MPGVPPPSAPSSRGAQRRLLGGGRWHFQHGPIDLVIAADGDAAAVAAAHEAAWASFDGLLAALVAELPLLRQPVHAGAAMAGANPLQGAVARRMWAACAPLAGHGFITPMAAVAGAVAQQLIAAYDRPGIQRAWVNNGGDIALHLAPGTSASVGLWADLARLDAVALAALAAAAPPAAAGADANANAGPALDGRFTVQAAMPVRGVATSGWRGRSLSLGIADSVTVLAATAAQADAAATVIANAVTVDAPGIVRRPADELRDHSDLGRLPATAHVPPLPEAALQQALRSGLRKAQALQRQGLIHAAALVCQGSVAHCQPAMLAAAAATRSTMLVQ